MKTQHSGTLLHSGVANQSRIALADVDQLANEIFALLNDENRKDTIDDVQQRLSRAASMLVRPSATSEAAILAALQDLPQSQLDVLFAHLAGMTCPQIAERLDRSEQEVFKDLTSAYVRLRFSVGPTNLSSETPADGSSQDELSNMS